MAPAVLKLGLLPNATGLTVLVSAALALESPGSGDASVCKLAALLAPNWTKDTFGISGAGEETFAKVVIEEALVDEARAGWVAGVTAGAAEKENVGGDTCVDPLLKPGEPDPPNAKIGLADTCAPKDREAEKAADSVGLHPSSDFLF